MAAEVKIRVNCETTAAKSADATKSGNLTSRGKLTRTMSATSSDKYPVRTRFGSSELKEGYSGYSFDGTSGLTLSSSYTKPASTTGGFIIFFSQCINYSDKTILSGGTGGGSLKFVDSNTLQYVAGGGKGATTTIDLDNTTGSTTSYTYGTTDVEALIWTVDTSNTVQIWNINGDRIFNGIVAGAYGGTLVHLDILHNGSFAGPALKLLEYIVYEDHEITQAEATNLAAIATGYKD